MNRAGILFLILPVLCLADASILDYVEPFLNTPVVATNTEQVTESLLAQDWRVTEDAELCVTAERTAKNGEEHLTLRFSPGGSTATELHQDIVTVEYTYIPWLEYGADVERWKEEFNRLVEAFDYLIGPGVTETSEAGWSHTWPERDSSRIELLLEPMWDTRLTVSVNLVPLREPEND